ncbi:MAG: hypothetical protein HY744_24600 [Deltaproteobacteria bacterium]|nr:hypothetical protein [Deltaproteobacteria bacterium]
MRVRAPTLRPWGLAAAVALAAALPLASCARLAPPAFPHRAHLESSACGGTGQPACTTCLGCHEELTRTEQRARFEPEGCTGCHEPAGADVRAEAGRLSANAPKTRTISFTHRVHLALPEIRSQCVSCHAGVAADGAAGHVMPAQAACLPCHQVDLDRGDCRKCHGLSALARLVPRTFLRHDESFARDHALQAASHARACEQCHRQSDCTDCHDASQRLAIEVRRPEAIDRSFVHRADFVTRHAIEARSRPASCVRCHTESSCDACHTSCGVSAARVDSTSPHPIGWIGRDPTSPNYHGRSARRDVVLCAGCHDQGPATNCIRCHRVGGFGGNPHPSGWRSSQPTTAGMCGYCHAK